MNTTLRTVLQGLVGATLGATAAAPASAAEYWLQAVETAKVVATAAGSETLTMWEYAACTDGTYSSCTAGAPGPLLRVPAGEGLTVHLRNGLERGGNGILLPHVEAYGGAAIPTSFHVPGLPAPTLDNVPAAPVPFTPSGASAARFRSFTAEVANGQEGTYAWTAAQLRPGSFVYQSGTHPQVQVQMGLYGALVVEAAAGAAGCSPRCAYDGVGYDHELVVVYSEIHPEVHAQVADGSYGDGAAGARTSTVFYDPQYFFVDGSFDGASTFTSLDTVDVGNAGDRVLLRLVNAGLESHSPQLVGGRYAVVGEDGAAYPSALFGQQRVATLLAAGKGLEALWVANADGSYPLLDRRRMTANAHAAVAATGTNAAAAASGMLVKLRIGAALPAPEAAADGYATDEDVTLTATTSVLANDPCAALVAPDAPCTTASVVPASGPAHGILNFNADGTFTYVPAANFNGVDGFRYAASNGQAASVPTQVTITVNPVNDAPVANGDGPYDVGMNITTLLPALVANDVDVDGDALTVYAADGIALGGATAMGGTWSSTGPSAAVSYTPPLNFEGADSFNYVARDAFLPSNVATVQLNVVANLPPLAVADPATTPEDTAITLDVLGNDSDPDGVTNSLDPAAPLSVQSFTQPATGGAVTRLGNQLVFTPAPNFNGTVTFTYTIVDAPLQGAPKTATATVTVVVTPVNDPPVARNNTFALQDDVTTTFPAPGVLNNDTDVDGDPLVAVLVSQPANATITLQPNGGFTIVPGPNFNGVAVFTYQARDPSGALSNIATVRVVTN